MLTLTRLPDWDRRLARVVNQHARTPGEWGVSDCLLTVMDAVAAVTGFDPSEDIRGGKYSTAAGATKILLKRGLDDVEAALASLFPPVAPLMAQRGDVGVVERDGVLSCGFVCDRGFAVKDERGLSFAPQTEIKAAFKVG